MADSNGELRDRLQRARRGAEGTYQKLGLPRFGMVPALDWSAA